MINVLLPCMGNSVFFKDSYFPKLMTEVGGMTMLERVVDGYASLAHHRMIFIMGREECTRFHIDDSAKLLCGETGKVIRLAAQTKGALCTCLMAVEEIDNDDPLIIANSDQVLDEDMNGILASFASREADAGLVTFRNVHPRWSYARVEGDEVTEVAEKRPISPHAIAGLYYYRHGRDFIRAAKSAIKKEATVDGIYYISATINELILSGAKVCHCEVDPESYHSFYTPEKIKEYEKGEKV
ncbi:MAG: glycosyltransferase family 2 protein [Lachnospiraceae bacterium]|nr:glycosyltransferase family 2 protein [Lachnospiraceae bacterium]